MHTVCARTHTRTHTHSLTSLTALTHLTLRRHFLPPPCLCLVFLFFAELANPDSIEMTDESDVLVAYLPSVHSDADSVMHGVVSRVARMTGDDYVAMLTAHRVRYFSTFCVIPV